VYFNNDVEAAAVFDATYLRQLLERRAVAERAARR
jgi:hypothetical protein